MNYFLIPFICGLLSLVFTAFLFYWVSKKEENSTMLQVAKAIRVGARAYLLRLYQALFYLVFFMAIILALFMSFKIALSYIIGAISSSLAGFFGMQISVRANSRTAWAAKKGRKEAFPIAYFGGSVMGLSVVGLALLGITVIYYFFRDLEIILGFSFGASSLALLAKAGGGIYTKAADVGADLSGKVERQIPEDDPRNPAVIADNVGDIVGDVAGTGADIYDSFVASIIAAMLLGVTFKDERFVFLPLLLAAAGASASIVGTFFVWQSEEEAINKVLNRAIVATAVFFAFFAYLAVWALGINLGIFWATLAGLLVGVIIGFTTDLFTGIYRRPVRYIAKASNTGAAINILGGLSYSLLSILPGIAGIGLATMVAWSLAEASGFTGVYGIAIAAVGMLAISGTVVSADAYGPIADNARGIAEQSGASDKVVAVVDHLDAVGNTAKAVTKGFAIGAAGLTVLALLAAYTETAHLTRLDLLRPGTLTGVLLGALMPPLFSALLILSVGRGAQRVIEEVRRQFKEIPGLLKGKAKPDYHRCVDIVTKQALKELFLPGVMAIFAPIFVGFILGKNALGGFLVGSISLGLVFAFFMANAGAMWDNAKKLIEEGRYGGSGSKAHRAAVIGDTIGDPFKDTAGPSLNTLLAVMALVSMLIAPFL
jgi:K(+)-stimulated pyrophosphate-energized sodium pump